MAPAPKIGHPLAGILYHENMLVVSKLALPSAAVDTLAGKDVTQPLDIERLSYRDVKRLEFSKRHKKSGDSRSGRDRYRIHRWLRALVQRSIDFFIRVSTDHGASDEVIPEVEITEEEDIERLPLRWHSSTLRQQRPNQQRHYGQTQLQRGKSQS